MVNYCDFALKAKIEYELHDERQKLNPISFTSEIQLREYQTPAIDAASKKDIGVIISPPGTGKTVIALRIIADKAATCFNCSTSQTVGQPMDGKDSDLSWDS